MSTLKVEWIKKGRSFCNPYTEKNNIKGREVNSREETKSADKIIMSNSNKAESKAESRADSNEFLNTGLMRWEQRRAEWLKGKDARARGKRPTEVIYKSVDVEDTIERIYSPSGNGKLAEPLPLGQIIDILIDFWEADGLYD